MGFFRSISTPYSFDFMGVGTDKGLRYDFSENTTSLSLWDHDLTHMASSNKNGSLTHYILPATLEKKIAHLRKALQNASLSPLDRVKIELSFFQIFHEESRKICSHLKYLSFKEFLDSCLKKIENSLKLPLKKDSFDHSDLQYETNIKTARSLKIPLIGETLDDQQRSFLRALHEGYTLLLSYVTVFDKNYDEET